MKTIPAVAIAVASLAAVAGCTSAPPVHVRPGDLAAFQYEPWGISAGDTVLSTPADAWAISAEASIPELFTPSECAAAWDVVLMAVESDAEESDSAVANYVTNAADLTAPVLAGARQFDDPASAKAFVNAIPDSLAPCLDGYSYAETDGSYGWSTQSLSVSTSNLDGFGPVVVVSEHGTVETVDGTPNDGGDVYETYIGAYQNVLYLAAFQYTEGGLDTADVAAGFAAFKDYVDAIPAQ